MLFRFVRKRQSEVISDCQTVMVFENVDNDLIENIKALARSAYHTEDIEPSSASVTFGDYKINFGW